MSSDFDPEAPLPSYDLEEVGAEQAIHSEPGRSYLQKAAFDATDDPFEADAPLPRFPLGENTASGRDGRDLAGYVDDAEVISTVDDFIPPPPPAQAAQAASNTEGLEDVLDEADFFATRGLHEDARAILLEQLARTPNHPLVLERLREIDAALGTSGESQTIERSQLGGSQAPDSTDFDVAQSLGALDELGPPPPSSMTADPDVDGVFEKFKAGIRSQVSENDSATHYDLGVAYKEMGLISEAIHEFELAGRDSQRECMCFAMIGMIYLEQNQLERAAEAYVRALSSPNKNVEQEMNLYYDLGNVYEMKRSNQEALYYFQKIARRDPGYRDTADRIASLQPSPQGAPSAPNARAVNDPDEFDSVFDDLFEGKR
jgi:tetratricopeptide (TPR) repeat protein